MKTYAIGDIHGQYRQFREALDWIEGDALFPSKIICLGDYIDRGPDSEGVLDLIMEKSQKEDKHEWIFLRGNHEEMLLDANRDANACWFWLDNGGHETLLSFGLDGYANDVKKIPEKYIKFLMSLRLYYEDDYRIYVHAGISPIARIDMSEQTKESMLWIRHIFLESSVKWNKKVVHGHTPVRFDPKRPCEYSSSAEYAPVITDTRINLDTGCVFGGPLSVGIFDSIDPQYFETKLFY